LSHISRVYERPSDTSEDMVHDLEQQGARWDDLNGTIEYALLGRRSYVGGLYGGDPDSNNEFMSGLGYIHTQRRRLLAL